MTRQRAENHPDSGRQGQDSAAAVTVHGDGAGSPSPAGRRVGFFAVCLAYCAIILDGSVLNVAVRSWAPS